jgi:hypothetical protein
VGISHRHAPRNATRGSPALARNMARSVFVGTDKSHRCAGSRGALRVIASPRCAAGRGPLPVRRPRRSMEA